MDFTIEDFDFKVATLTNLAEIDKLLEVSLVEKKLDTGETQLLLAYFTRFK
jgi:hypothetical protein